MPGMGARGGRALSTAKTASDTVVKNARKVVDVKELGERTLLIEDLGYDSIDFMELIIQIEGKYDVEFGGTEILLSNLNSINIISDFIQKKLQERKDG